MEGWMSSRLGQPHKSDSSPYSSSSSRSSSSDDTKMMSAQLWKQRIGDGNNNVLVLLLIPHWRLSESGVGVCEVIEWLVLPIWDNRINENRKTKKNWGKRDLEREMQQSVTAARRRRRSEQLGKKGHPLKSGDVGGGRGLEALHHLKPPILSGFKLLRSVFFSGFFAPPQTRGSTVRSVQV